MINDFKAMSWFQRIQIKMSCILIVMTTILLLSFAQYNYFATYHDRQSELHTLAASTAKRLAKYLVQPIHNADPQAINEFIDFELVEPRISAILVTDQNGQVIRGRQRQIETAQLATVSEIDDSHDVIMQTQPIVERGSENTAGVVLGEVRVYVNDRKLLNELDRLWMRSVLAIVVLNGITFIISFVVLGILIRKPLMNLTQTIEQFNAGEKVLPTQIGSDEIGLVAKAFNRLMQKLS